MIFLNQVEIRMLTNQDIRHFYKVRKVASVSDFSKTHVGCVAVYHGKLLELVVIQTKLIQFKTITTDSETLPKLFYQNYMQK